MGRAYLHNKKRLLKSISRIQVKKVVVTRNSKMFGFNHSQNSLTNSNGTVFRTMLKIVQKNPPELLQISVGNIKKFADKVREDILIRVTGVFPNLQIRPQSAISNDTYFENNHGFK